jgi:hypothetical protein
MSWTISHGAPGVRFGDCHVRSGKQVGDWRDAMNQMPLSARDRSIVEPLIRRRSNDPFTIHPARAAAIATVLRGVLRQMPRAQREMHETLAAAAERAAAAGEPWRWS